MDGIASPSAWLHQGQHGHSRERAPKPLFDSELTLANTGGPIPSFGRMRFCFAMALFLPVL